MITLPTGLRRSTRAGFTPLPVTFYKAIPPQPSVQRFCRKLSLRITSLIRDFSLKFS